MPNHTDLSAINAHIARVAWDDRCLQVIPQRRTHRLGLAADRGALSRVLRQLIADHTWHLRVFRAAMEQYDFDLHCQAISSDEHSQTYVLRCPGVILGGRTDDIVSAASYDEVILARGSQADSPEVVTRAREGSFTDGIDALVVIDVDGEMLHFTSRRTHDLSNAVHLAETSLDSPVLVVPPEQANNRPAEPTSLLSDAELIVCEQVRGLVVPIRASRWTRRFWRDHRRHMAELMSVLLGGREWRVLAARDRAEACGLGRASRHESLYVAEGRQEYAFLNSTATLLSELDPEDLSRRGTHVFFGDGTCSASPHAVLRAAQGVFSSPGDTVLELDPECDGARCIRVHMAGAGFGALVAKLEALLGARASYLDWQDWWWHA